MADLELELADVRRYRAEAAESTVAGIVKHYGIALANPNADSAFVASKDASELETVREKLLKGKLGLAHADEDLHAAIDAVMDEMADDNRKRRVTATYLLAERFDALGTFG